MVERQKVYPHEMLHYLDEIHEVAVGQHGWFRVHRDWIIGCVCSFLIGFLLGVRFF